MKSIKDGMITASRDQLAEQLRALIDQEGLGPGDRLPTHEELSHRLGVGIRRLREGLSVLRQQGLIVTKRKGGTVVAAPSIERLGDPIAWHLERKGYTFQDMVEARASIESSIAGMAAARRSARDLLGMLDAIEQMEKSEGDWRAAEQADQLFHQALLRATGNPIMQVFGQLIAAQFRRKAQEPMIQGLDVVARGVAEHRAIYHAIERGDRPQAQKRMHDHVVGQLDEWRAARMQNAGTGEFT